MITMQGNTETARQPLDIVEGRFYVNERKSATVRNVRQVLSIRVGYPSVHYMSYALRTWEACTDGLCSLHYMQQWATRRATAYEITHLEVCSPFDTMQARNARILRMAGIVRQYLRHEPPLWQLHFWWKKATAKERAQFLQEIQAQDESRLAMAIGSAFLAHCLEVMHAQQEAP